MKKLAIGNFKNFGQWDTHCWEESQCSYFDLSFIVSPELVAFSLFSWTSGNIGRLVNFLKN
jgi:hypothetical protein